MGSSVSELERVVREVLAPLLRADGGVVYLVSISEKQVSLHVGGRYAGCPGNTLAKRRVLEPALRAVAEEAVLELSSGAIVPDGAEQLQD